MEATYQTKGILRRLDTDKKIGKPGVLKTSGPDSPRKDMVFHNFVAGTI